MVAVSVFLFPTSGHNCEFLPCEASNPCENGAMCVEELDQDHFPLGFRCRCRRGFTGPRCEINVDECSSSPCFHGFCYDGKKRAILPARLIALKTVSKYPTHTNAHCEYVKFSFAHLQAGTSQLGHHCCLLAAMVLLGCYEAGVIPYDVRI